MGLVLVNNKNPDVPNSDEFDHTLRHWYLHFGDILNLIFYFFFSNSR